MCRPSSASATPCVRQDLSNSHAGPIAASAADSAFGNQAKKPPFLNLAKVIFIRMLHHECADVLPANPVRIATLFLGAARTAPLGRQYSVRDPAVDPMVVNAE